MKNVLRFGTSGVPISTRKKTTAEGIRRAKELGLTTLEIAWVHTVPQGEKTLQEIRTAIQEVGFQPTIHAPYYINLNSLDPQKLEDSIGRVVTALESAAYIGARSVCVHTAFNHDQPPAEVFAHIHAAIEKINVLISEEARTRVKFAIETMGKPSQFGSLTESLTMAKDFTNTSIVLDVAHLYARTQGTLNSYEQFVGLFREIEKTLGKEILQNLHMHISGIAYGRAGELHHLPLRESGFKWEIYLQVLKDLEIGGDLICESPETEADALLLQETYARLK